MSRISRAGGAKAVVGISRSLVAAAACAQVTHAVMYGSLLPHAGAHGYLAWYLPVLAGLSLAVLALVPAARLKTFRSLLPERRPGHRVRDVSRVAFAALAFLLVQESLEHLADGGTGEVTFPPLTLLVAIVVLVLAAAVVVALERTLEALVARVSAVARPRALGGVTPARSPCAVRRNPLSLHRGLRAPPLTV